MPIAPLEATVILPPSCTPSPVPTPPLTPPPTYRAAVRMSAETRDRQDTVAAERMAQCDEAYAACFAAIGAQLRSWYQAWCSW